MAMQQGSNLPDWLREKSSYTPSRDRDSFVDKGISSLVKVISKARYQGNMSDDLPVYVPLRLFYIFALILMCALSKNALFLYIVLAGVLLRLCTLSARAIARVLKPVFAACAFSVLILLPSVFLGSPRTLVNVTLKVFISVSLMGILSCTQRWGRIIGSLKKYHIPDIFIFTLDTAIRFIVILGDEALSMLGALKIRSIGKNRAKSNSMTGVLGVLFLKSQRFSQQMSMAMECRGFSGSYGADNKHRVSKYDLLGVVMLCAAIGVFIYSETVI